MVGLTPKTLEEPPGRSHGWMRPTDGEFEQSVARYRIRQGAPPGLTGHVDFFFDRDAGNVERLHAAVDEFWDGDVPGLLGPEDLEPDGIIIQFGLPPNWIDLINSIAGVGFDEAWAGRGDAVLVTMDGGVPLPFIGLEALVKNKRATGRPKDLDDLSYLTRKRGASASPPPGTAPPPPTA